MFQKHSILVLKIILIIIVIQLSTSCVRYKNLVYLQQKRGSSFEQTLTIKEYKIHPNDDLKIEFTSTDPTTSALLNRESGLNASTQLTNISIYISSYRVDSLGYIEIPLIKKVHVLDMTLSALEEKISNELAPILKLKNVVVKMANSRVSVMGEVKNPGTFYVYNDRTTIFQAIALAGDVTDMGNRHAIKVIRNSSQNQKCVVTILDITKLEIIASDMYYVYPNDVIYVEPAKAKTSRINLPILQATLTGVTAILLLINVLLKI